MKRSNLQEAGFSVEPLESRRMLSAVWVAYTFAGDANLDGTVDTQDFTSLVNTFSPSWQTWASGDFNYDGAVNTSDFMALASNFTSSPSLTTLSTTKLPPIRGNFVGSYKNADGKFPMSLTVLTHTHTGHFTGEAGFGSSSGTAPAAFTGKVASNLHVHIDFSNSKFSGTLTGLTTHTGGQISGSYSVTGSVKGTGTFKVIKP